MHEMSMPLGANLTPDARYPRHDEPIAQPSWVIAGVDMGSRVRLFASDQLTHGELKMIVDESEAIEHYGLLVHTMPKPRIFLTLEMREFVMIDAVDWRSAFEGLFRQWAPGGGPRLAIGSG